MNINSHIQKIIVLAFVVLSLSFIFPAVSYAATEDLTCKNPNQINEEYILTNVGSGKNAAANVLSKYKSGVFFSGVYNVKTGQWMALPSEGASLKEEDNSKLFCTVAKNGGHPQVAKRLFKDRQVDNEIEKNNVGFAIMVTDYSTSKPTLNLRYYSNINCPYTKEISEDREAKRLLGEEEQKKIESAIKEAVGNDYIVEKDKYSTQKACPPTPGS
jgi:hypothetical protein